MRSWSNSGFVRGIEDIDEGGSCTDYEQGMHIGLLSARISAERNHPLSDWITWQQLVRFSVSLGSRSCRSHQEEQLRTILCAVLGTASPYTGTKLKIIRQLLTCRKLRHKWLQLWDNTDFMSADKLCFTSDTASLRTEKIHLEMSTSKLRVTSACDASSTRSNSLERNALELVDF